MKNIKTEKKIPAVAEIIFDTLYLLSGTVLGLILILNTNESIRTLYGIMALLLVFGDSFHLIPRMKAAFTQDSKKFIRSLGRGKMVTSITMTVFYALLWHIGLLYFSSSNTNIWTMIIYALSAIRILLCLCPQNRWTEGIESKRWNTYRNIPFLLLGAIVMIFYMTNSISGNIFQHMPIAIFLSFAFYVPVVWGSGRYPKLGMLMIPKSCVYIWIICMGLNL